MTPEAVIQRETIFSKRRPSTTDDKRWGAGKLQSCAAEVLGTDLAETIRDTISPRSVNRRDSIDDPMVRNFGSAFVTIGKALGLDEGKRLSYIAALLYVRLGKCSEAAQPLLEDFAVRHLQPEEAESAKLLSYLLEMSVQVRDPYLHAFGKMTLSETERIKTRGSVDNAWKRWNMLAVFVEQKENETPVPTRVPQQRKTPVSRGYGGRA